jgi:ABC-type transport system substrate-binding protein
MNNKYNFIKLTHKYTETKLIKPLKPITDIFDPNIHLMLYTGTNQTIGSPFYRLDPIRTSSIIDKDFFSSFLFRTLFKYNTKGELCSDLAENFGVATKNFMSWTFNIRKQCFFESGVEIKPSDIAYGISRCFADIPNLNNESTLYPIKLLNVGKDNNIFYKGPYDRTIGYNNRQKLFNNAVVYDDAQMTLTFNLKVPVYEFKDILTLFEFSTPVPVGSGLPDGSDIDLLPISSGPYMIDKLKSKSYLTSDDPDEPGYIKNADIKLKHARYKTLVLRRNPFWINSNDPVRTNKQLQNVIEIHFGQSPEFIRDKINNSNKYAIILDNIPQTITNNIININNGFTNYIGINSHFITSKQIRKALYYALDPQAYIQSNATLLGINNPDLYASQFNKYIISSQFDYTINTTDQQIIRPNLEYAKQLLNSSKITDPICYNYITSFNGIQLMVKNKKIADMDFIKIWKKNLLQIGIILNITYVEKYYTSIQNDILPDLTLFTFTPEWNNAYNVFNSLYISKTNSPVHLLIDQNNNEYTKLLKMISNININDNSITRKTKWHEIETYALEQMWIIPLCTGNHQIVVGTNIKGIKQKYQSISYNDLFLIR